MFHLFFFILWREETLQAASNLEDSVKISSTDSLVEKWLFLLIVTAVKVLINWLQGKNKVKKIPFIRIFMQTCTLISLFLDS